MGEGGHFGGMVEEERNDGGIVVAVDDEAETFQPQAEVARVEDESLETLFALAGDEFAVDDAEGGGDLGEDGGRGGLGEEHGGVLDAEFVDDGFVCGDVASVCSERFC